MEEYKFSDSNLDFNELLDKYKVLDTTYSDIDDFKINIYENCNLLQDDLITAFTVPSTNIRLSSFKNNYIIADTQTLDLDRAFYTANPTLFSTVEGETEGETYINNIDLTNIITTYFNYANDDIYPSKKIIITINLLNEIVDTDGSGALQIDMKEIKEHFHSVFDTLELDINQYVTGKHGTLAATGDAQEPPNNDKGGSGQNANVNSAGPAINITNNNPSYFQLNIKTNGKVSGGFGASGGRGGNGKINATVYVRNSTTGDDNPRFTIGTTFVAVHNTLTKDQSSPKIYTWVHKTLYFWDGFKKEIDSGTTLLGNLAAYGANPHPPTISPVAYPESNTIKTIGPSATNTYTRHTYQYVAGNPHPDYTRTLATDTVTTNTVVLNWITRYYIKKHEYTAIKTGAFPPASGNEGSTANYSHNAKTENIFPTQAGDPGTDYDGTGGTGGTKGNPGGITNITAADTNITVIEP